MKSSKDMLKDMIMERFSRSAIDGIIWDNNYMQDLYGCEYHDEKLKKEMRIKDTELAVCPSHTIALLIKNKDALEFLSEILYTDIIADAKKIKEIMDDDNKDAHDTKIVVSKRMLRDALDFLDLISYSGEVELVIRKNKKNGNKILLVDGKDVRFALAEMMRMKEGYI